MSKAQLLNLETGQVLDLPRRCTIGRADDNRVVVSDRWVSRHHCVIERRLLAGWCLRQLGEHAAAGPTAASFTTVRREGRVCYVRGGERWKLASGDTLAFGKPPGDATIVFSHEFRLVQ